MTTFTLSLFIPDSTNRTETRPAHQTSRMNSAPVYSRETCRPPREHHHLARHHCPRTDNRHSPTMDSHCSRHPDIRSRRHSRGQVGHTDNTHRSPATAFRKIALAVEAHLPLAAEADHRVWLPALSVAAPMAHQTDRANNRKVQIATTGHHHASSRHGQLPTNLTWLPTQRKPALGHPLKKTAS